MRKLWEERGEIAEAAVTIPLVLLLALGLVNLAMAGYAAAAAENAAQYGARMGSVAQANAAGVAAWAAASRCSQTRIGTCSAFAYGGGQRGSTIVVLVQWSVPNFYGGIARFFGIPVGDSFRGVATATFRQEGW
ncbi:MAG: TadE/TadG family type IV pilus assembly protein [Candidatus Hadarchaeales archaeon]